MFSKPIPECIRVTVLTPNPLLKYLANFLNPGINSFPELGPNTSSYLVFHNFSTYTLSSTLMFFILSGLFIFILALPSACPLPPGSIAIPPMDSMMFQIDSFSTWNPQTIGFLLYLWEFLHSRLYYFCTSVLSLNLSSLRMGVKKPHLFLGISKRSQPRFFSIVCPPGLVLAENIGNHFARNLLSPHFPICQNEEGKPFENFQS